MFKHEHEHEARRAARAPAPAWPAHCSAPSPWKRAWNWATAQATLALNATAVLQSAYAERSKMAPSFLIQLLAHL